MYQPIPFDHTYILYDPADIVLAVCVQLSLLPIYIMVFYTLWFLVTREVEPVGVVCGHLVNEALNKAVKHVYKQPRPDFHKDFGALSSYGLTYGMPLAHSQFMGFFAAYYSLVVLKLPVSRATRRAGPVLLGGAALAVAFSRVYLLYHTPEQVLVGLLVGAVWGVAFFVVSSVMRDVGLVDWVLLWRVVRFFYVKDSYHHHYRSFAEEWATAQGTLH